MSSNELAGTQATISLGDVLGAVGSRVERQFEALLGDLPHQEPGNRPQALLQFVHGARQQLLRSAAILHDTRKFMAAQPLVEPGGILDVAASHVRSMRQAADELHSAGIQLQGGRVPLYNMPDALDVLATGTYNNFPKEIPALPGQPTGQTAMQIPLSDVQKQRLTDQMNHMLYSRLLKAYLPSCLQLVKVVGGYAVVRCKGLYEAQLYLLKRPYPPQVEEVRQEAAADAAKQVQEQQQQEAGTSATAETRTVLAETAPAAAQQPASSSKQEADRWVWALWHAVVLPNAAQKSPLRPEQLVPMLNLLRIRMDAAVDAAAVEAGRQQGKREGLGGAAVAAAEQSQQRSGPANSSAGPSQPTSSGVSNPAASTMTGATDQSAAAGRVDAGRGLDFKKHAADEVTFPLIIMHGVLRDIAAQLLLDEATAKANRLAGAGSKWEGHLRLTRAEVLTPGVRMHYWQKVPVLLAAQPAGVAAASSSSKDSPPGFPAVEVGVGSDGTVQVMHLPPLRQPGSLQQVPLLFDSHTVDVEGLLLQAVALTASTHLQQLQKFISQGLQKRGLGQFAQLHCCSLETDPSASATVAGALPALAIDSSAAAACVSGGSSAGEGGVPVGMPSSLVVSLDGNALVGVSFQPWSGKVLLRPGSMYGGHRNMEMGIHLHQQQELLQQKQEQAKYRRTASTTEQQAAQQCLLDLGQSIADICGDLWLKVQLSSFLAAARRFGLHHTNHTLKGLHQQHVPTLQLPSAAAAMDQGGVRSTAAAGTPAGTPVGTPVPAAAAAVGHVSLAGRGGSTLHLAMPQLQLPPYMLLLTSGSWCQDRLRQRKPATVAAAAAAVPSMVAAIGPTLCLSFPRRRVVGESRDWLLLMLCDAQGLAGPVLKSVRIPVTCFTQQKTAAAAEAGTSNVMRKRKRDEGSDEQQQQQQGLQQQGDIAEPPAGAEASAAEAAEQRQDRNQQQQQRQEPVFRVSPEDHSAELAAAVHWSQSRITFERLLLEMHALQLQFMQVQQQQQQGLWQQPAIQLQAIPGVDLFKKLQRKEGCRPSSVGLSEVWFTSGPEYGMWSMQLRGSFYHQHHYHHHHQQQQQRQQHGPGGWRPVPQVSGDPSLEQVTHYQYDLRLGHDVRSAVLQLVRIVHLQQFLHRVETLALGNQRLQVLNADDDVSRDNSWGAKARSVSETAAAAAAGASDVAAAGDTTAAEAEAAADDDIKQPMNAMDVDDHDAPAAKRHKLQQQQQQVVDVDHHFANGPVLMNGVKQEKDQQLQQQQAKVDGLSSARPEAPAPSQANGVSATAGLDANAATMRSSTARTDSGSPFGLLFQWQGTGLVRLAQYSIAAAVLECGAPLAPPPPATLQSATAAVKLEPGSSGTLVTQQQQQQQRRWQSTPHLLCFTVTWQPRFEFNTHRSSSSRSVYSSSSSSTTWVDVRPSTMQRGSTAADGWPPGKAARPTAVLAMACSISCNAPHVPTDALNELSDMVDSGCVDVVLDSLAVAAWPLGAVAGALAGGPAAAAGSAAADDWVDSSAVGAADHQLQGVDGPQAPAAAGAVSPAGVVQALHKLGVTAVSSSTLSGIFHVRYKFRLLPLQRQQPPQGSSDGSSSSQTVVAVQYTAGALAVELMFASHGRTKMLVTYEPGTAPQQHPDSSVAAAAGDASNAPAPAAAAAAGEGTNNAPATAAASQMLTVDLPAALLGFYKRIITKNCVKQQQGFSLLPVLPRGRYLTALPQPGSLSAREGIAGFYVQNQHLGLVLQQLLRYWQQIVVPDAVMKSRSKGAAVSASAAAAPSAAVEAAAPAGLQQHQPVQDIKQELGSSQQLAVQQPQQQQQQQQPVAMAVDAPGVQLAAAQLPPQQQHQQQQQQFLQQQQQQQQHVTPKHLMHAMHQPAAGHVASGL